MADFLTYALKAVAQSILPLLESISNATPFEFDSFDDVLKLYDGGIPVPKIPLFDELRQKIPFEMLKELLRTEGNQQLLKLPKPQVIQADEWAWRTDEEFTREMLAGVNPLIINRLDVFPPVSKLDPSKYGNQNSTITAAHIQNNLDGSTVDQALKDNRLFILDHHDTLIPYLNRINSTGNKIYASRTLLFLKEDSTLKPLAIELSLPSPDGEQHGAVSNVYTPSENGVEGAIWQLAKAYATVNDSGVHQLISHWLNTHATMEPFVIATNRQLSALHPINKLLSPHYRDTMNINALARQILINAGGILELTVFPARYAMEMSSFVYKSWNFMEEALPADLIKRGILVGDGEHPDKEQLLIKDYPYAVDGLAIWHAIETWVSDYCSIYYPSDAAVQADAELQAWWKEVREVGHGDKKDEPWIPAQPSHNQPALHAGAGSADYEELKTNPDKVFLRTVTSELQTILGVSLIEILSTHSSDEVYLGQRDTPEWTADQSALQAFERFKARLAQIEADIVKRNGDPSLKNRNGPVKMPYTLLYPTSTAGITGKGIPNSVSI
uniref:Lipoxygenase n=1 Tax=Ananas comosus var. bracteatus TaxID=296719 RepID=A0A6V7Q3Q0_ANACO|nr:unnamed protein product [Ananas comosus var. bracteatus]